ncbi:OmpA family protein [Aestuariirhabdus sp. Z084]|uniref:OmpA family protein n=1 Tax=Aestuariirhabdus haliotis TaxID=2918751 RepID=UPI00201B38CE|nr:OmpA family protein [Aestuariirhabdus haliotis]MCL6417466.1 OmpA family protein [Aestuariirhabdus haliotis]MCL6421415.1 OmpA family protein [Aestuariirhabdus haliotis]
MQQVLAISMFSILVAGCANTDIVELNDMTPQQLLEDSDRDGVIDARDRCENTESGANIDNGGCSKASIESLDVTLELNFKHDSAQLADDDIKRVAALAQYLKLYPSATAVLDGHTSKVGGGNYNFELGLARARAVRDTLVSEYGIAAERIDIASYGYQRLKRQGLDENAHASNRRVEVDAGGVKLAQHIMKWTIYTSAQ